jgi:ERCC4-type nuclease
MARTEVDTHEPDGMLRLLHGLGIDVSRMRFWAGDYEVADRAIVERKTVRGLHAAIIKGTFWPQLGRMRFAAVPGISEVTAKALLLHFGSLAAVVDADPSVWEQVRGIGRQRSRAMTYTFHGAPTASGSRRSRERQDPAT